MEYVDVLVVGAGISGIGAGYYLQKECPDKSYTILEAREELGGTWSLFQYPGIRSDSDMFTLGYTFRPWPEKEAIAEGGAILKYLKDTAQEFGIASKIRYGHRVEHIAWSSEEARWEVTVARSGSEEPLLLHCNFLYMCSGYYRYDRGYTPEFPGFEKYQGEVIHPQLWPEENDYTDKRVVVIGSGATAVTLVPSMAQKAAHVTMLQRSPTYLLTRPARDLVANTLRAVLPKRLGFLLVRWLYLFFTLLFYRLSRRRPQGVKRWLLWRLRRELGKKFELRDFEPSYAPWDQRICVVPDSDLFKAIRAGDVSVVTDHIETFTEKGIELRSGQELEADIVVTATGLELCFMGDVTVSVDGEAVTPTQRVTYKGIMMDGLPNLALSVGYINASWTLKTELISRYVCDLLRWMDAQGHKRCVPRLRDEQMEQIPYMGLQAAGYVKRSRDKMPKQGTKDPWQVHQNHYTDSKLLHFGASDDALEFS